MFANIKGIVTGSIRDFTIAPFLFLLFQVPEAIIDGIELIADGWLESRPLMALALLFPVYCLSSSFSAAWTYLVAKQIHEGRKPTFRYCLHSLRGHASWILIQSSLAVGLVVALGVPALLLPAFYFMAVYLFVPWIIADGQSDTVGAALARSKRLIDGRIIEWICIVMAFIALGLMSHFGGDAIVKSFNRLSDSVWLHVGTYVLFKLGISLTLGVAIDLGLSHTFIKLKGKLT